MSEACGTMTDISAIDLKELNHVVCETCTIEYVHIEWNDTLWQCVHNQLCLMFIA